MRYSWVIDTILNEAGGPLTPQQIRDRIKQDYPTVYDNPTAHANVAKGHVHDLDHALTARIYTATASAKRYKLDRSVSPLTITLLNDSPSEKSINRFFQSTLGLKLSNPRWSWGSYDLDKNIVVLRLWTDQIRTRPDGGESINILTPGARDGDRGFAERKRHLEEIRRGAPAFAVICVDKEKDARSIESFDNENIFRLGQPKEEQDGSVWCDIVEEIPVREFVREIEGRSLQPKASYLLEVGSVYTREQLKEIFETEDATINTGVFRPKGFSSVFLFVTEEKTPDRTQYADKLDGDTLHWQGQNKGRTDNVVIEHTDLQIELLLFYRNDKYEHPGAGFRYEGLFNYVSHKGDKPKSFVLARLHDTLREISDEIESQGKFDATSIEDGRKKTLASIVTRQGQSRFRKSLLAAYGSCCAITGCKVVDILEAAHIMPYRGPHTNHVSNGLLLRADLHTLFDLGLIDIEPESLTILVASSLLGTEYAQYGGKKLRTPTRASHCPSSEAIILRRDRLFNKEKCTPKGAALTILSF